MSSVLLERPVPVAAVLPDEPLLIAAGPTRPRRSHWLVVAALTLLGILLRVPTLGHQSFWIDEAAVANLLSLPHGDLVHALRSQTSPPLYYPLIAGWSGIFGTGELALRSFSALIGCLTVPLAFPVVRRVAGVRAGVIATAFVATSPEMVWFSQEARSYSLLILLTCLSLYLTVRSVQGGGLRSHLLWGVVAAAALATHYFSVFVLLPELLWLVSVRSHRRHALAAGAIVAAVGMALVPLVQSQTGRGYWPYYADLSLVVRARAVPGALLLGEGRPMPALILVGVAMLLAGSAVALACVSAWRRRRVSRRAQAVLGVMAIGTFALLAPLVLALAGRDFVAPHNFLGLWFAFATVAAAGCAVRRTWRLGTAVAVALCVLNVGIVAAVFLTPRYQRDDWRDAIAVVGETAGPRALVFPTAHVDAVRYYATGAQTPTAAGATVDEIDVFLTGRPGDPVRPWPRHVAPPAPGFHEVARETVQRIRVVRFRADAPQHVTAAQLTAPRAGVDQPDAVVAGGEG